MINSALSDAAHGAGVFAGAAVNALATVDSVMAESVVHSNSFLRASLGAGTASDAAVVDNVHNQFPPMMVCFNGIYTFRATIVTYSRRLSNDF